MRPPLFSLLSLLTFISCSIFVLSAIIYLGRLPYRSRCSCLSIFLPYFLSRSHILLASTSFYSTNILHVEHTILPLLLSLSLSFPFFEKRLSCRTLVPIPIGSPSPYRYLSSCKTQNCISFSLSTSVSFAPLHSLSPFNAIISLSFSLFRQVSLSRGWIVYLSPTRPFLARAFSLSLSFDKCLFRAVGQLISVQPVLSLSRSLARAVRDRVFPSDSTVPFSPPSHLCVRAPHEEARSTAP